MLRGQHNSCTQGAGKTYLCCSWHDKYHSQQRATCPAGISQVPTGRTYAGDGSTTTTQTSGRLPSPPAVSSACMCWPCTKTTTSLKQQASCQTDNQGLTTMGCYCSRALTALPSFTRKFGCRFAGQIEPNFKRSSGWCTRSAVTSPV